uniref:Uncharacterized protein n=1 Tax=Anguilla anguilla TaxID=7936 RepID=A0A0E9T9U6_ANGAN
MSDSLHPNVSHPGCFKRTLASISEGQSVCWCQGCALDTQASKGLSSLTQ